MANNVMISVILPVFNTKEEYLRAAIESILNQTYRNFELLIIDDASSNEVRKVLETYTDPRIRIFTNSINLGITKSLNIGLKIAQGEYIARMDADDISERGRFEEQLFFMEQHPETIVLGGLAQVLHGTDILGANFNIRREIRKIHLSFYNEGIIHPTAFMRRKVLKNNNLCYDEEIQHAQDYELWTRCIEFGDIAVLPKVLLKYRIHKEQISTKKKEVQHHFRDVIKLRMLEKLGDFSTEEKKRYLDMTDMNYSIHIEGYLDLIEKLLRRNEEKNYYNKFFYKAELRCLLLEIIRKKRKYFSKDQRIWQAFYPTTISYFLHVKISKKRREELVKRIKYCDVN